MGQATSAGAYAEDEQDTSEYYITNQSEYYITIQKLKEYERLLILGDSCGSKNEFQKAIECYEKALKIATKRKTGFS